MTFIISSVQKTCLQFKQERSGLTNLKIVQNLKKKQTRSCTDNESNVKMMCHSRSFTI